MKFFLILAFLPFALKSEPLPLPKSEMVYVGIGGYLGHDTGADLSLGYRKIAGNHGLDINGGTLLVDTFTLPFPYIQSSYLFFPEGNRGPYLGAGLTLTPLLIDHEFFIFPNIPITTGYQFKNQFVQFQYGVFSQSGSISYGVGF